MSPIFPQPGNSTRNIQTIEDMQNFVEGFSEFSAAQRNAGKHVTLMSELSAAVESRGLMQISSVSRRGLLWLCLSTELEDLRCLLHKHLPVSSTAIAASIGH
jgi:Sec1 family